MARPTLHPPFKTRLEAGEIGFLTGMDAALKLSLSIPFHPNWNGPSESRILLRDLRDMAADLIRGRGALSGGIEALLEPVDGFSAVPECFAQAGRGLALFSDGEEALALALPEAPAPSAQVDFCFRLENVLPQIQGRDRFYLLQLAQHGIRLWDCDSVAWSAIPLEGFETDIRKMPHFESAEYQALFHSTGGGRIRTGRSSYSGIGLGDKRDLKTEIEGFFRQIDHGIRNKISGSGQPLILAGTGFLLPLYRRVNTYPCLAEPDLPGHPESMGSEMDLHRRAVSLLQAMERKARRSALAVYRENLTNPLSCSGYTDLLPCAAGGRLTHLFLAEGSLQWGDFEPGTGRTLLYDGFRDGAMDLSALACIHAVRNGAVVYPVPRDEMPVDAAIAGLVRT